MEKREGERRRGLAIRAAGRQGRRRVHSDGGDAGDREGRRPRPARARAGGGAGGRAVREGPGHHRPDGRRHAQGSRRRPRRPADRRPAQGMADSFFALGVLLLVFVQS